MSGVTAMGLLEPQVKAILGPGLLDLGEHRADLRLTAAVATAENVPGQLGAIRGCRRIEFEGLVDELHLIAVLEGVQRLLQARAPDVAPGADDVGPDFNSHRPLGLTGSLAFGHPGPQAGSR